MAQLGSSGLENHPDGTGNINAIVNGDWVLMNEYFNPANGLTASQSGTTVTANSAIFIADMVGATIRWANGTSAIIGTYVSATQITATVTQTVASQNFDIYRADVIQTPYTAFARGLLKRCRMLAADNGKIPQWNSSLGVFQMVQGNTSFETLGTSGTITLDFSGAAISYLGGGLTGNLTLASSNLTAGAQKTVIMKGELIGSATLTFPGWQFVGSAVPTSLAANKFAKLSLLSTGTTDAGVIANYDVQP